MEGVEGMMKKLQLSSEERRSIKIRKQLGSQVNSWPSQAVAKLFSDRNIRSDVIEKVVGWISCPAKGIACKDLGDNVFLISFNQETGLRRALDDGPWMVSKELLVVVEFDESKALEEFDFSSIPIWMRVKRLPFGLMNRVVAETIGDDVGAFMEVDADGGESAVGRVLRIKIRLDIRKPLHRGIMKLGKNELAPFSRELRYMPPRKPMGSGHPARSRDSGLWRSGSSDSWSSGGRSRSDGLSWRKDLEKGKTKHFEGKKNKAEEVTSPLKEKPREEIRSSAAKTVLFAKDSNEQMGGGDVKEARVNSSMQEMVVAQDEKEKEDSKNKKGGKFKRVRRDVLKSKEEKGHRSILKKREGGVAGMEVEVQGGGKKPKQGGSEVEGMMSDAIVVGLSEQPCESK
ncbi:hypothetical protein BDA96_05G106000 [Sorghum bicolor]|uniref:DUF4283 domain-containing protein n=1 Tax=Sorghum bicolor TaxID=4558 RepID=A0A921UGA9_SORBI|nr:hypothetical protein BDA96_05G106000 [Sorghum bicolor]